jgi:hypothetical protein
MTIMWAGRPAAEVLPELSRWLRDRNAEPGEYGFTQMAERFPDESARQWLAVYPVRGDSEAWYVHLAVISRANVQEHRLLGLAKTWDTDSAWKICRVTAEALDLL